ncbi:unnamed protein product [Rotaria sordida]|uniref:Uncharacterized protein n=1 Tax=Rotaria sordida TaxID=392033 RepID=A0A814REY8_9BILA|nr:unnamed protein product [Rotaria sordida]
MAIFCRQHTKPISNERAFCQALLNNENPIWDDNDMEKIHKRGFRLPPDNFVYGIKHPKQNALQYDNTPMNTSKSIIVPNFIEINKTTVQLGLTKVQDIHQYRKTMNNHLVNINPCYSTDIKKKSIPDMIHGRITGERQSIRDLIENKYLHEWLHKAAIRRCKKILNNNTPKIPKAFLLKTNSKYNNKQ